MAASPINSSPCALPATPLPMPATWATTTTATPASSSAQHLPHRGQGAILQNTLVLDQTMELLGSVCPSLEAGQLAEIRALMKSKLPPSNADIAPGLVPNVMTGRIANRLNLKGPNYLLDAACSSSLLAVNAAIDELRSGRSRMMLAGGVNASLPAEVAVIFTSSARWRRARSGRSRPAATAPCSARVWASSSSSP